jgi:RHS repeat-associated protein/CSLREA domain-containing protein
MFAVKPRTEMATRLFLITAILFYALVPSGAFAKPTGGQNTSANSSQENPRSIQNELPVAYPGFERPIPRINNTSVRLESNAQVVHDATITCTQGLCSDRGPGVILTQVINSSDMAWHSFRIQCPASPCASRDIYWRVSMDFIFGNSHPSPPVIPFYATINGGSQSIAFGKMGTGGVNNVFCGNAVFGAAPGTCHMESSGVIQKEIIAGDPNMLWYDHFFVNAFVSSGVALTWARRIGTIQVSYDKSLLDSGFPAESANCKGCNYGPAQGWAADPINTHTGVLSYSVNDLEIPTGAGLLSFRRTYVSSLIDKFTSPLGYGWVHNQDLRLIFPAANEPAFVHFKDPTGNLYRFWYIKDPDTGAERYSAYAGFPATLTKNSGSPITYTLQDQTQHVYTFDQNGKITSLVNPLGQTFNYSYVNGNLDRVSADGGAHFLAFTYDPQNRLQSVRDHTNTRSVTFHYDPAGDLDNFDDVLTKNWDYQYLNHRLTRIADSNNNTVLRNEYHAEGKAWKQFDGEDNLVTSLQYTTNSPVPPPLYAFDFESGNLNGWTIVSGNAFSALDVTNLVYAQGGNNESFGQQGNYHLWGYKDGGDGQVGVLQSNTVTLPQNPSVRLLVAGGNDLNNLYVALVRASDGVELFKATGLNSEFYRQIIWDASAYTGQAVYIKAVDNSTGGWGHVNIDDVEFISMPATPIPAQTTTVTDGLGNISSHAYDSKGTLMWEMDPFNAKVQKSYDSNFRVDTIQDPLANPPTTLGWSSDGANLEYIKDRLNHETYISYNSSNRPTNILDPMGYETKYFYNDPNFPTLPTRIEYPLSFDGGATYIGTNYTYYPPSSGVSAGKVELVTDALGHKTHYTYTSFGQPDIVITNYQTPNAQTTNYDHDNLGRLVDTINPQGMVTHLEYDNAGHVIKQTLNYDATRPQNDENKYNLVTRYRYDQRGNQIAVVDTYWAITRTYYDLANRPIGVAQNLVINGTPAQNDADVTAVINATPNLQAVPAYDPLHADRNIVTKTEYDDAGNTIITRDPAGIITRTYYDAANRPKLMIQNWAGTNLYDNDYRNAPAYVPAYPDQNVRTEYFYDDNGNVIATKDTLGVITRTYYDALNRPKVVIQNLFINGTDEDINATLQAVPTYNAAYPDRNLRTVTYYDANGNVILTIDPKGTYTRTYYDALNHPTNVVQNLVGQTIIEATSNNATPPTAGTSNTNIRTDTFYDQVGNVIATVDPRGTVTRTYYDEVNRPEVVIQNLKISGMPGDISVPLGQVPAYNPAYPDRNIRSFTAHNQDGRLETTTDPLDHVTKYEYDTAGQLVKLTVNFDSALGQNHNDQWNIMTTYDYDALGRQVKSVDPSGRITLNTYDDIGRLTSTKQNFLLGQDQNYKNASGDQFNLITTFSYDARGHQIAVTDTKGVITRTYYDALGQSVTVVRNLYVNGTPADINTSINALPSFNPAFPDRNIRTDTRYLGNGSVDYLLDELGEKTDHSYDALGRLISVLDPLLNPTNYAYDANGNRTLMTDAEGLSTKYGYDDLNRLVEVIENFKPTGADSQTNVKTTYTYDASGNRLSIRDGNSNLPNEVDYRTVFTYDALGRLKSEKDPLNHETVYGYDKLNNKVSLLDANGQTTLFGYDALNRMTLINYPGSDADVTFDYDAVGRRQSMTDELGVTVWTYNNLDLPAAITDPFGTGISYDYDPLGNRTNLSYGSQALVYKYDAINHLTEVTGGGLPNKVQYGYDAVGRLKSVLRPNGIDTAYNYYDNGWLQDITHSLGASALASYQYQYYKDGHRKQAVENVLLPSGSPPPTNTPSPTATIFSPTVTNTPTLTSTPSRTSTASFTPSVTSTSSQTPTLAASDLIFADGFESGNLSAWTSSTTDSGDLSVNTAAALIGSQGLQSLIDDLNGIYVTDDTPSAEPRYRARFYFDPNSITMANGDAHFIFKGYEGTSTDILRVEFRLSSGLYQIRGGILNDSSTWVNSNWFTINDAQQFIELDWHAATAAGANNGSLTLWIDGIQLAVVTGVDNDTWQVDRARLGALSGIDAGTSGTYYFDAFESRRTTYIGPAGSGPTLTPSWTPTITNTPTATSTPSITPTFTKTNTALPDTATYTPSLTFTVTNTPPPPTATFTPGGGTVYLVSKIADTNDGTCDTDCSLREAVRAANASTGTDTILLPSGTYTLTITGADSTAAKGDLDISESVSIIGQGNPTNTFVVAASGLNDRIFDISAGTISISNITIQGGSQSVAGGGGIRSINSALTLSHVVISGNQTANNGGGVYVQGGSLSVTDSAVVNNTANYGGGLLNDSSAVTLTNVTISGNSSVDSGGGMRVTNTGTTNLLNVTITNNTADSDSNNTGEGGGIFYSAGTVTFKNTIIAGNIDASATTIRPDCSGTVQSSGHNLIGDKTGCTVTATTGDLFGTSGSPINPQLGPLQDNGGNTITHTLLSGSPAIDSGDSSGCPTLDQRGFSRDAMCDMGAYELGTTGLAIFQHANFVVVPPQQSGPLTFTPVDDAYIANDAPSTNYGSAITLQTDNTPIKDFLLKFTVSGVNGQSITNAKIRLYNVDSATKGGDFYHVANNSWQQSTVTWNNAPAAGSTLLASLGSVSPNTWYEVDVTSLITGDGTYSLRVSSTSSNGADYSSKEGANPPQLVITLGTATATFTPTATRTSTPTNTLTPTITNTPPSGALPDLVITQMKIEYQNPSCLLPNDPFGVRIWVTNNGTAASGSFIVSANGLQQTVTGLAIGETKAVFFETSNNPITAIVDVTNTVAESNESNNSTTQTVPVPTQPLPCTPTPVPTGYAVTINYDYDPLKRLTAADYSTSDYYHYTYDAVGNRLTQASRIGGQLSNSVYDYDDANRLRSVNGVTYTWDNNGNLLNDGVNTYSYNFANQLKTLTGSSITATYSYNGLGDRLRQTLTETTTTFTMDLNTGLSQVLSDGANHYVYGNDRIAQMQSGITEYFLTDALTSVRQITNNSGTITYARAYDPYGVVLSTAGSSQSAYGYSGEYSGTDTTLLYLRARFYRPSLGRFLTKDNWEGDVNSPMSYNLWNYVDANPINRRDPSGYCYEDEYGNCVHNNTQPVPPSPDYYGQKPKTKPAGIVWSPSLHVFKLNLQDAQGNPVPSGTTASQFYIKDKYGNYITGACGPLSVAAIAQWWDPNGFFLKAYELSWTYTYTQNGEEHSTLVPVDPNYTSSAELEAIIESVPVWDAYTLNNISDDSAYLKVKEALNRHHFAIPGVNISGSTGIVGQGSAGHWLVITGLAIDYQWNRGDAWQWIQVFNPFNNQDEYYMWSWFKKGWGGSNQGFSNKTMVIMCSRAPVIGVSNSTCDPHIR